MNSKLLFAALATAFSGITFATETPNYDNFPVDAQQYCRTYNTEICQELAAFMTLIEEAKKESLNSYVCGPTEEQIQKGNELLAALTKEMAPQEGVVTIKKSPAVLEYAKEKAQEASTELAEKLAAPQE